MFVSSHLASGSSAEARCLPPDIWRLLQSGPRRLSPEIRTDLYLACSPRAGVKLSYGKSLELKLLCETHENGAESWMKVFIAEMCSIIMLITTTTNI